MMYDIYAPVPVDGKHWELHFRAGHTETEDPELAAKYRSRGYMVREREEGSGNLLGLDSFLGEATPGLDPGLSLGEPTPGLEPPAPSKKGK